MPSAQMPLHAPAPAAHKREIQHPADDRAGQGNHSPDPLFRGLGAELRRQQACHARRDFFAHWLPGQIFAVINSRRRCRRFPHLYPLVAFPRFESVKQREPLNQTQGNDREQARVRKKRDHAAKPESRALDKSQPLGIADQRFRNGVQMLDRDIAHPREARNPQAVPFRKLPPELLRVNLNRAQSSKRAKPQEPASHTARDGAFPRIVQLHHAFLHHKVFEAAAATANRGLPGWGGRASKVTERGGQGWLERVGKRKSYLTRKRFWVNCIFLYGHAATIRSRRYAAGSRVSAARGRVFLWFVLARPFCRPTAARYRGAERGPRQMAPRSRARSATERCVCAHVGLPAPRARDLRRAGRIRRPAPARSVNLSAFPQVAACARLNLASARRLNPFLRLPLAFCGRDTRVDPRYGRSGQKPSSNQTSRRVL